jgi:hypothetical protein
MGMNDRAGQGTVGADAANFFQIEVDIADVSADTSYFSIVPFSARLARIYGIVDGAIATADLVITAKNNAGTAITGGALTLATAGSAAGTNGSVDPTAGNVFTQGQKVELALTGAGAGGTPRGHVTMIFEKTGP